MINPDPQQDEDESYRVLPRLSRYSHPADHQHDIMRTIEYDQKERPLRYFMHLSPGFLFLNLRLLVVCLQSDTVLGVMGLCRVMQRIHRGCGMLNLLKKP